MITVLTSIIHDPTLWPYFRRYYLDVLKADRIFVLLFNGITIEETDSRVFLNRVYAEPKTLNATVETMWLNRFRLGSVPPGEWYCAADLDEFQYYSGKDLPYVVTACLLKNMGAVHGQFVDRIGAEGNLVPPGASLDESYPMSGIINPLPCQEKITLARGWVPITNGKHSVPDGIHVWFHQCAVHHFKWRAGVVEHLRAKAELYEAQGCTWVDEIHHAIKEMTDGYYVAKLKPSVKIGI